MYVKVETEDLYLSFFSQRRRAFARCEEKALDWTRKSLIFHFFKSGK